MITPLRCVSQLVDRVKSCKSIDSNNTRFLEIINSTIKLLLAATKETLDSTMLKVEKFVVKPTNVKLIESVIKPVLELLAVNADSS